MTIDTVAVLISALSVLVTAITFFLDFQHKKHAETVQTLESLYDLYYSKIRGKNVNDNYGDYVEYMGKLERFAIGVNERLYSLSIVRKQASILFKTQYEDFMKKLIDDRRKQFRRESYYQNIERLINKL